MPSRTIENYLKQLYLEEQHTPAGQPVAMGRLAAIMRVVPGTATTMVKTLADARLVDYSPRSGVHLTAGGNKLALHVLRRHRLVELFLVQVVGLDWSEVHAEAEELEHVISDRLLARIDTLLGHPTTDPHGDPIPSPTGQLPPHERDTLVTCPLNKPLEIARVIDQEPRFLQFVDQRGLTPGARIKILERNSEADSVTLQRHGIKQPIILSSAAAAKFVVKSV